MKVVSDASVSVKWFMAGQPSEVDADRAQLVLSGVLHGSIVAVQPPHWLAEVVGVLCRVKPIYAAASLGCLYHSAFRIVSGRAIYRRAVALSMRLNHRLPDTLYHAVALEEGGTLVTADEVYFNKAQGEGAIIRLADFAPS